MEKCEFCALSPEEMKWLLYENEHWYLFLADRQDYAGRCLISCKRHCESISELSADEWLTLKKLMEACEAMLKNELGADLLNWSCLMNDAFKQNEPVPHVHFHLRPRYSKPIKIGNTVFKDKEFGHHYNNKAKQLDNKTVEMIFERLKSSIDKYFK